VFVEQVGDPVLAPQVLRVAADVSVDDPVLLRASSASALDFPVPDIPVTSTAATPSRYGRVSFREAMRSRARAAPPRRTGRFLGVPYDWRRPTWARLRQRWWNRGDHRIFTPKAYGWGYDVNVRELARRLRLRR
jgi:hypothetical protein